MYLQHCNVSNGNFHYIYCICMMLGFKKMSIFLAYILCTFFDSVINNNIYQICFSFSFFSETPLFQNVTDLYKKFTSCNLLLKKI